VSGVLRLLESLGARTIVLGRSRDDAAGATCEAVARAWVARGGEVLDVVDWPETAASWLRQARRFTAHQPDAWVVAARPSGWKGMCRRLIGSAQWAPRRTIVAASLTPGDQIADGVRGVTAEGRAW
jgi:hypothetical protein